MLCTDGEPLTTASRSKVASQGGFIIIKLTNDNKTIRFKDEKYSKK